MNKVDVSPFAKKKKKKKKKKSVSTDHVTTSKFVGVLFGWTNIQNPVNV